MERRRQPRPESMKLPTLRKPDLLPAIQSWRVVPARIIANKRTIALAAALVFAAVIAVGAWVAGSRIESPADAAARTAPPTPSPILVPIEKRVLSSTIVTRGTARFLSERGIPVADIPKIAEGRPNLLDKMKNGEVALIINTPSGRASSPDEGKIRGEAVKHRVTCITTISAAKAAAASTCAIRETAGGEPAWNSGRTSGLPGSRTYLFTSALVSR